jgi:Type IV secretion system pilin
MFLGGMGLAVPLMAKAGPNDINILEPLPGGVTAITPGDTWAMGAFVQYMSGTLQNPNGVWKWAFGVGVGIAVLNCTFAGLQIVLSNGDQAKVDEGKNRFKWSTLGLLMLFLAGTLLNFINPAGFTSSGS